MKDFFLAIFATVNGVVLVFWAILIKYEFGYAWSLPRASHQHTFPGEVVLIGLSLIAWGLWDLLLHGGPKARRQAKFEAQRQAEQAQARARASSPVEASAASEAPCSTKQPGDAS
jgi:lysylphosphatidylglycerol synthetase-like protein (DUF2156 family)